MVAANNILSDPVKRSAYDCYGAGWNGMPDVRSPRDNSDSTSTWGSYNSQGGGPESPNQNATWEDWERWYQRDSQGPQKPTYVSNGAFVTLILVLAVIGGIGQATRVGNYSMNFIEQRDAQHDKISQDLMKRKEDAIRSGSREERIHRFLRQRDSYVFGDMDPKEGNYRRLSEATKGRALEIYQPKSNPR